MSPSDTQTPKKLRTSLRALWSDHRSPADNLAIERDAQRGPPAYNELYGDPAPGTRVVSAPDLRGDLTVRPVGQTIEIINEAHLAVHHMRSSTVVLQDTDVNRLVKVAQSARVHGNIACEQIWVFEEARVSGDIFSTGLVDFYDSACITGRVFGSKIDIAGCARVSGDINARDDVLCYGDARISGAIHTAADLEVKANALVAGDVYVRGNPYMDGCALITGNVKVNGECHILENARMINPPPGQAGVAGA